MNHQATKDSAVVISGLLAVMFLFSGMKLMHPEQVKPMFVKYGYAAWFATFIGVQRRWAAWIAHHSSPLWPPEAWPLRRARFTRAGESSGIPVAGMIPPC